VTLVPDGDGYIEVGDDGAPLGRWEYDEDTGEWIFDPVVPLGEPPATGDNDAALWMALTVAAVFGAAAAVTRKKKV
jgi:LPXTG-motif cell wall-anchored protein